jgi:hypothetical protein
MTPQELEIYRRIQQDVNPAAPNFVKALSDLRSWAVQFPNTAWQNDRQYYFIHVYNGMGRPDSVLNEAEFLVSAGVASRFQDPQQVLQILVAASASLQKLPAPTPLQFAIGQKAARQLLDFLPGYFAPRSKPADVTDAAWSAARTQLESVARQALDKRPPSRIKAN